PYPAAPLDPPEFADAAADEFARRLWGAQMPEHVGPGAEILQRAADDARRRLAESARRILDVAHYAIQHDTQSMIETVRERHAALWAEVNAQTQAQHSAPPVSASADVTQPQLHAPSHNYSALEDLGEYATPSTNMGYNAPSFAASSTTTDARINPPSSVHTAPHALAPMAQHHADSRQGTPPPGLSSTRSDAYRTMPPPPLPERGSTEGGQPARNKAPRTHTSAAAPYPSERTQKAPAKSTTARTTVSRSAPLGRRPSQPSVQHGITPEFSPYDNSFPIMAVGSNQPAVHTPAAHTSTARVSAAHPLSTSASRRRPDVTSVHTASGSGQPYPTSASRSSQPYPPSASGFGQPYPTSASGSGQPYPPSASGFGQPYPPSASGSGQPYPPSASGSGQPYPPSASGSGQPYPPFASMPPVASGSALPQAPVPSNPAGWGQSGHYEQLMGAVQNKYHASDPYGYQQFLPSRSPPPQ
ncbi:hypothetical protein HWV62_3933, partial [Athelia sp. TMB]